MKCKHCGKDIIYVPEDAVFLHKELTWGHGDIFKPGYNNRYYCTPSMKTAATPTKQKLC